MKSNDFFTTTMDAFSPELAPFWLAGQRAPSDERKGERANEGNLSPGEQVALEELAERVNAARSVV
jgi:hypothetical protein